MMAVEKNADHLRREVNDNRRQLNDCNIEKDKYLVSNKELRDFIKKSEAEKREQARSLDEGHQRIAGSDFFFLLFNYRNRKPFF